MVRFGAHAFIWAAEWNPTSARKVIAGAAAVGLDFVEIPLLRPREFDIKLTQDLLGEFGLAATASLGLPLEVSLPEYPEKARDFLMHTFDVAHQLGCSAVTGVTYASLGGFSGRPPKAEDYAAIVQALKPVARHAAGLGMKLGLEPVNRYETYLLNLTSQGLDLIAQIDEPNVFLHLDTYHMNIEEKGFKAPIVQAGKHLQYIHLSESDRGTPGKGNVHWDEVFSGLQTIGFNGDLVMESFVALNPDIAKATCMWRDVVGDPQALMRDGLAFLRDKTKAYGLMG